ncbi:MAG TPA: PEP-CTERM sorting domain-containing protein [Kamptonema sp.]|nr:PEP-CTERM sorting domain-containing protein [Kamptonema sp.]
MKTTLLTKLTATTVAATAMLSLIAPANAATVKFGTDGLSFDTDTTVNFTFLKSKGAAISSLGIYDSNKSLVKSLFTEADMADGGYNVGVNNEWLGTAKNLVGSATASFTFLANQVYSLGLTGNLFGTEMTSVYSTSSWNLNSVNQPGKQQAVFDSVGGKEQQDYSVKALTKTNVGLSVDPLDYPVAISFEDMKWGDNDFNDFTIEAEAVPEPITMAGMALGAGGMAIARRRRNRKMA